MRKFVPLFVLVPVVELVLLVAVSSRIGALPTLLWLFGSAALGASLARREGLRVLRNWQQLMAQGRTPDEGLVGAALAAAGGLLLIVPGLLTDVAGVLLLFPPTRRLISRRLRRVVDRKVREGRLRVISIQRDVTHSSTTSDSPRPVSRLPSPKDEVDADWVDDSGPR